MSISSKAKLQLFFWYKDPALFFKDIFHIDPYPYQKRVLREFPKLNRIMILAASDTGKSKLISCIGLWSGAVLPYFLDPTYKVNDVVILGGSREQANRVYSYMKDAMLDNDILREIIEGEPLMSKVVFKNRSKIQTFAKSLTSVQGIHADTVIVDEAAFKELDFYIQDTLRIVSPYPHSRIILSSSPHEYDCYFVRMWEDRKRYPDYDDTKNSMDWKRYHWTGYDCPRTRAKLDEAKKLPTDVFERYYMGNPYDVGDTLVPIHKIRMQSDGVKRFKYDPNNKYGTIIFGIDYGFTAGSVLVITQKIEDQYRVLDVLKWKEQKYEDVQGWIEAMADIYKPDYIYVDMLPKEESQRTVDRLSVKGYYVKPISFSQNKLSYQMRLKALFEQSKVWIPEEFVDLLVELKKYKYDTKTGDDHVVALMLACTDPQPEDYSSFYFKVAKVKRRSYHPFM